MKIDHFVLTTESVDALLAFYTGFLGMRHEEKEGRHALFSGDLKINIHTRAGEFQPAAAHPTPGSLDLCFTVREPLETVLERAEKCGIAPVSPIVERYGARGIMQSVYFRDPDGNLIELSRYGGR